MRRQLLAGGFSGSGFMSFSISATTSSKILDTFSLWRAEDSMKPVLPHEAASATPSSRVTCLRAERVSEVCGCGLSDEVKSSRRASSALSTLRYVPQRIQATSTPASSGNPGVRTPGCHRKSKRRRSWTRASSSRAHFRKLLRTTARRGCVLQDDTATKAIPGSIRILTRLPSEQPCAHPDCTCSKMARADQRVVRAAERSSNPGSSFATGAAKRLWEKNRCDAPTPRPLPQQGEGLRRRKH